MTQELLPCPCPFCGDTGAEVAVSEILTTYGKKFAVYCNTCFCEGPPTVLQEDAVITWNTRPTSQAVAVDDAMAAIERNCWSLMCDTMPTGAGDADVMWVVISYHMSSPRERVVATGRTPSEALQAAMGGGEK